MSRDILHDRGRAEEAVYFHKHDVILLERLRRKIKLGEIAEALAEKLKVDNRALLERIAELGVTVDTGGAFILAPLVEVAWADGEVSEAERETILRMAADRGVAPNSADMNQLQQWLENRPPIALFALAVEAIKVGISVLPPDERAQRVKMMVAACEEVAHAAGGLHKLLRRYARLSPGERTVLNEIASHLAEQA